jgi:hypothetical protein
MFEIGNKVQDEDDEDRRLELGKEFYELSINYFSSMNRMMSQLMDVKASLENLLGITEDQ